MELDKQIQKQEEELSRLKAVKEAEDSSLLNRVRKVVYNSTVFDFHNQKTDAVKFNGNDRNTVIIRFDEGFSTWDLASNILKEFDIHNIYTSEHESCMFFVVTERTLKEEGEAV